MTERVPNSSQPSSRDRINLLSAPVTLQPIRLYWCPSATSFLLGGEEETMGRIVRVIRSQFREVKRDNGLNVQHVLIALIRSDAEVCVVLQRNAIMSATGFWTAFASAALRATSDSAVAGVCFAPAAFDCAGGAGVSCANTDVLKKRIRNRYNGRTGLIICFPAVR